MEALMIQICVEELMLCYFGWGLVLGYLEFL